jgi:hypothetical protein
MSSERAGDLEQLAAIQAGLRQIPEYILGCRLLHWDPALAGFLSKTPTQPDGVPVYLPLSEQGGPGKARVLFAKTFKSKYPRFTLAGTGLAER